MRKIIKKIENKEDLSNLSQYELHVLLECYNQKYISNVKIEKTGSGRFKLQTTGNILIEKAGLDFVYPTTDWVKIITMIGIVVTSIGVFKDELLSIILQIVKLK